MKLMPPGGQSGELDMPMIRYFLVAFWVFVSPALARSVPQDPPTAESQQRSRPQNPATEAPVTTPRGQDERSSPPMLAGELNAAAFIRPGDANYALAINRAIAAAGNNGRVRVPPGNYENVGDIIVRQVGRGKNGATGTFQVDMTGVIFSGAGNFIVDSSKQVSLIGLDAKGYTFSARGMWNSVIRNCNFDVIAFADAPGTNYSTAYWNTFDNVGVSVVRYENGLANANTFRGTRFRGDGSQGFPTARAYAFEFNKNFDVQANRVIGGDASYYSSGIYRISPEAKSNNIDLIFEGTYFDTAIPDPNTGRDNARIAAHNSWGPGKRMGGTSFASASKGDFDVRYLDYVYGWRSSSETNFVPNGDLSIGTTSYVGPGRPVAGAGGANITERQGSGSYGRYLSINQPNEKGIIYFASSPVPYTAQYSGALLLRAPDGKGGQEIKVGFAGQYVQHTVGPEWTLIGLSALKSLVAGSSYKISLSSVDGQPFAVDLAHISVTAGDRPPLLSKSQPQPTQERLTQVSPSSVEAGPAYSAAIPVHGFSGIGRGDFLQASFDQSVAGLQLVTDIFSPTQVMVRFYNPAGNPSRAIPTGTLRVHVRAHMP